MQIRPTVATIDLAAIRHNLGVVRRYAPQAAVCAVIKANAYGHGLLPVGKTLAAAGADWLAVALVEEGVALRGAGVELPILVLGNALEGGYATVVEHHLTPAIGRIDQLEHLARAAHGGSVDFHLKIDTGMARLGVVPDELDAVLAALAKYPQAHLQGVLTHFANADLGDPEFNHQQLERFKSCLDIIEQRGLRPDVVHIANSAAVLSFPDAHGQMVRPGLMLYGLDPMRPGRTATTELRPAMRWTTRPVHVKNVPANTRVSYGGRWTAPRASRIATLPLGYADGYPRLLSNRAQVLIRGKRAAVVGTVCMDLFMVDVTDIDGVTTADEVVLLGEQGGDAVTAYELAQWAETIPYEIVCGIAGRVPRTYVGES